MKMCLNLVGAWPSEALGERDLVWAKIHRSVCPYIFFITFLMENHYLSSHSHLNFFDIGHCCITTIFTSLVLMRSVLPLFTGYHTLLKKFFLEFHSTHYKVEGNIEKQIIERCHRLSAYLVTLQMGTVIPCAVIFFGAPIYKTFTNSSGRNEYAFFFSLPWFDFTQHFKATTLFNFYLTTCAAISIGLSDILLCLMVLQIIAHFKILIHRIENLPLPAKKTFLNVNDLLLNFEMYDEEENLVIRRKLQDIIDHHRYIKSFLSDMSKIFGPYIAFTYLMHLVVGCLLMLECSQMNAETLGRYGTVSVILNTQLILTSIIFEYVGLMSEKLNDTVYLMPWECMNRAGRRTVLMLLGNVQKPVHVTALGMVPVGVVTMSKVLKTTFTYFTILRARFG